MRTGLMGDIIRSIEFRDATGCGVLLWNVIDN